MALLTHVTFRVSGERPQFAAFDARLKLLFAEQQVGGDIEEQHVMFSKVPIAEMTSSPTNIFSITVSVS
jgi:hypothetical protein